MAANQARIEAGGSPRLEGAGDCDGIQCLLAEDRLRTRSSIVAASGGRHEHAPEHCTLADAGCLLPGPEGARRVQRGAAGGEGDADGASPPLAFGVRQCKAEAALSGLEVRNPDHGELDAAKSAGEADQQGSIAQAREVVGDQGDDLGQVVPHVVLGTSVEAFT